MRRLTLTVTPEQAGRTVKSLLRRELHMADGAIARVKTVPDGICRNGVHARTVDRVAAGDILTVRIDDKRSGGKFTPVAVPLDILYEDADLLALNKPAGMAVHGGYDRGEPTVANALAAYLGPDAVFHPVNRLDRGTSGLMAAARHAHACQLLQRDLHTERFIREYLAVVEGELTGEGCIDLPIAKEDAATVRRVIDPANGLPARTHYRALETAHGRTLVQLRLETGRTHQIRVHLAAIGHPIAGDFLYGREIAELPGRFALHSAHIELIQPCTGASIRMDSPLPDALARLMQP